MRLTGRAQANGSPGPPPGAFNSPMAAGIIGRQQSSGATLADSAAQEAQAAASLSSLMISLYPNLIPDASSLDGLSM